MVAWPYQVYTADHMSTGSLVSLLFFISLLPDAAAQAVQEEKIYTVSEVTVKPQPVKGLNDFHNRWSKKVTYPPNAISEKVQGMVFVEFIVNKDGSITDAGVKMGIGHGCDQAALSGFLEVSKDPWKPGIKSEDSVTVKMVLPFSFRIIVQ